MKKIAFITPSYYPSVLTGSGIVVIKLAEALVKTGYDVSVITSNALTNRYWYDPLFGKKIKKKFEIYNGVKIYRLSCAQFYSSICFLFVRILGRFIPKSIFNKLVIEATGPYLIGLDALVRSNKYDSIHCSPSPLAINMQTARMVKQMKKKPHYILTPFFHADVGDFANPELKNIFSFADVVHTISHAEKNILQKKFGLERKKIRVIPLFLDTAGMHTNEQLQKDVMLFKKKHGLEEKKIVLFAGIKGYAKGATDTLLAVDSLYKTDVRYILITIGTDTKEWKKALATVDKKSILDLGYKTGKEKEIIFAASDIFCMPSKSESFGLVYLEAWHKKKPVIAAGTSAVKEFLGENGVYVDFGQKKQIINAILKLHKSKNTQKKLGESGYNELMKNYIFSKVFTQYRKLFTTYS